MRSVIHHQNREILYFIQFSEFVHTNFHMKAPRSKQHCMRLSIESMALSNIATDIAWTSSSIFWQTLAMSTDLDAYTLLLRRPHRKKSQGDRSGLLAGHKMGPSLPTQEFGNFSLRRWWTWSSQWGGASSCWKTVEPFRAGKRKISSIWLYALKVSSAKGGNSFRSPCHSCEQTTHLWHWSKQDDAMSRKKWSKHGDPSK